MLYEILKTAKLGTAAAPDMFTGLIASKMPFAKGSGEIAKLSGVPPLRFKSNGEPLLYWQISGNTVQNGTPIPANPVSVQGVGKLESGEYKIPISSGGVTTNIYLGSTQTVRQIKKIVFDGTEQGWGKNTGLTNSNAFSISMLNWVGNRKIGYCTHYQNVTDAQAAEGIFFGNSLNILTALADGLDNTTKFKQWLAAQYANGTPVTLWYVLATPETGAVNEPLMKIGTYADTLSMTDTGIEIPTVRGNNVLTVDTTVQPSEVYIKYKK